MDFPLYQRKSWVSGSVIGVLVLMVSWLRASPLLVAISSVARWRRDDRKSCHKSPR